MDETGLETNAVTHRIDQAVDDLQKSINMQSVEVKRRDSMVCRMMSDATSAINGMKDVMADGIKNAECKQISELRSCARLTMHKGAEKWTSLCKDSSRNSKPKKI
jgi:hypothetical protein